MDIMNLIVANIQKNYIMRDKKPFNANGQRHGHWLVFYCPTSDNIWFEANYVNGEELGHEMKTNPFGKREKIYQYNAR